LEAVSKAIQVVNKEKENRRKRAQKTEKVKIKKLTKKQQQIIEIARNTVLPPNYVIVWDEETLSTMCMQITNSDMVALDTETTGLNVFKDEIVGLSVWVPDVAIGYYLPLKHKDDVLDEVPEHGVVGVDYIKCLSKETAVKYLKPVIENTALRLIGHNVKFDSHVLFNNLGIDSIDRWFFDTSVASALLDENRSRVLKDLFRVYLKEPADRFSTLFGKETFDSIPILTDSNRRGCLAGFYAIKDAYMTWRLYEFFNEALNRKGLENLKKLMFEIEMPLLPIVWRAESEGVRFDSDYMVNEVAPKLFAEIGMCKKCKGFYSIQNSKTPKNRKGKYVTKFYFCECGLPEDYEDGLAQKIWRKTGEFNLKSSPQLSNVLFNELKFPKINKKKPMSADKKILRKMRTLFREQGNTEGAALIDLILRFRSDSKLTDAFADKLPKSVVDGRVHTSFNTTGTRTLRFSSSSPNLQQLPSKVGGLIRRAFMADEGRLLLSADFSGQELRILAHVSKCPVLTKIFNEGGDVHAMTAVGIYNRMYNDNIDYDYFQYCRSLPDLFFDKGGAIDHSKLNDTHVKELYEKGLVKTTDIAQLEEEINKGKLFSTVRNQYGKPLKCIFEALKPHSYRC
jgi:DNA polymerase-1